MTTVRHAVQQTVSRLVLRTLRDRAQHAGLPSARNDATQALAQLLDYTPTEPRNADLITAIINAGIGCVMVDSDGIEPWLYAVGASPIRVGTHLEDLSDFEAIINSGVHEVEVRLPTAILEHAKFADAAVDDLRRRAYDESVTLKLDLSDPDLHDDTIMRLAAYAASHAIPVVTIPEHLLAVVQLSINSTTALKVNGIRSLDYARRVLGVGAARLGTPNALDLVAAARGM